MQRSCVVKYCDELEAMRRVQERQRSSVQWNSNELEQTDMKMGDKL
jgi:hypothetical protein